MHARATRIAGGSVAPQSLTYETGALSSLCPRADIAVLDDDTLEVLEDAVDRSARDSIHSKHAAPLE